MIRRSFIYSSSLALLAVTSSTLAEDVKQVLQQASSALGGGNLTSIQYSGSGTSYALGQNANGTLPWPKFNEKSYSRTIGFTPWASSVQRTRTQGENPPHGGGGQPIVGEQNQTQIVAAGTPAAATLADDLAVTLPQAFVKIASDAADVSVKKETVSGKHYQVVSFTASNKATTKGWINDQHLLERVSTKIDNSVLGDIEYEATFSDYHDFNGVKFPGHIVQKQAGYPVLDLVVNDVKVNMPVDIKAPTPPATPQLASEQLGNGVYLITGGYGAVAVDLKDHILVIEGGQNDQRSEAVINEVKRLIPNKPIRQLVNTHSHFDHTGGVRAYIAEGATIITHESNVAYLKKALSSPHTLSPDRLAQHPKSAKFLGVKDHLTITDGEHVVELYHQTDFSHHDGVLLAYLPKEKVLVEADAFNPPATPVTQAPANISPFNQSLVENIERLKLDVQRIIPIHLPADGRKVTLAELYTAVGKK